MAALFAVLCVEQWRRTRQSVLMWVAAGLYVLCAAVLERQVMLTAMVLSAIMVLLWGWWQFRLQNGAALPTHPSAKDPS
jgi:predicted branched-subunit amino acid permease